MPNRTKPKHCTQTIYVKDAKVKREWQEHAASMGLSLSELIAQALADYIKRNPLSRAGWDD